MGYRCSDEFDSGLGRGSHSLFEWIWGLNKFSLPGHDPPEIEAEFGNINSLVFIEEENAACVPFDHHKYDHLKAGTLIIQEIVL